MRRIHWILFAALGSLVSSGSSLALDIDGDGLDNSIDNCLAVPNPTQIDTDGDGYGNGCDIDFDQSGLADGRDVRLFSRLIRQEDPAADINGDGVVDWHDPIAAIPLWGNPPGPGRDLRDEDNDGVPLALDDCPSGLGGAPLLRGCSGVELALAALNLVAAPAVRRIEGTFGNFAPPAEYALLEQTLEFAAALLVSSARTTAGGDPCGGATLARRSALVIEGATTEFDDLFEQSVVKAGRRFPPPADSDEWVAIEEALKPFDLARARFDRAREATQTALSEIEAICDSVDGVDMVTGIVAAVDHEKRFVEFESGQRVGLALEYVREPDVNGAAWELLPGVEIEAETVRFDDGLHLSPVMSVRSILEAADVLSVDCGELEIVPFQLSPEYTGQPWRRHRPEAYTSQSDPTVLDLEYGMRLGINTSRCPDIDSSRGIREWGADITLLTLDGMQSIQLASFLRANETVAIPDWLPSSPIEIQVTTRKVECLGTSIRKRCGEAADVHDRTHAANLLALGSYCSASYDDWQFDVEKNGGFGTARVDGVELFEHALDDPNIRFTALGLPVQGGTYDPTVQSIGTNDPFAVLAWDWRFGHEADGWTPDEVTFLTGSETASALLWPHVEGTQAGHRFNFACKVTRIGRDAINTCADYPHTFHTLPLEAADIGQDDFTPDPDASHFGAYAWDMTIAEGNNVRASRAGVVRRAVGNREENCNDLRDAGQSTAGCTGNRVILEHADGTNTNYLHLKTNSLFVLEGQEVERGDLLGESGDTGWSGRPHLHWGHEFGGDLDDSGADDVPDPARFKVRESGTDLTCYELVTGDSVERLDP